MSQEMLIGQILRALANHSELITHAYTPDSYTQVAP